MDTQIILSFYSFTKLIDCDDLRSLLFNMCTESQILGTIIISTEGINASLSGTKESLSKVFREIIKLCGLKIYFSNIVSNPTKQMAFHKLKVLIKEEIVTLRGNDILLSTNDLNNYGTAIFTDPFQWNTLIQDKEITVLDVRNDYEIQYGNFPRSINPKTKRFSEFGDFISKLNPSKKIAMYCTGGIRCHKASSYMKKKGFKTIYQLKGGILNYMTAVPPQDQLWQGKCFVFHRIPLVENGCGQLCATI